MVDLTFDFPLLILFKDLTDYGEATFNNDLQSVGADAVAVQTSMLSICDMFFAVEGTKG